LGAVNLNKDKFRGKGKEKGKGEEVVEGGNQSNKPWSIFLEVGVR
jgi:hypothetical protein